jgi:hypothetical protein
LTEF